jgi:hypothetical protein
MRSEDFEKRIARRNQLSAVDVLGSFDFSTATIHLKAIAAGDITRIQHLLRGAELDRPEIAATPLSGDQFAALARVLPLAVHEYTHFIDATSTLWGLRHLHLMNAAYASNTERGGTERDFHHAKAFFDHIRNIRLPSYYTVVYKTPDGTLPWSSEISIGRVFDAKGEVSSRPVLFSRFLNNRGELLVRSPISTVSILEASAMAQEVLFHAALLERAESDFRLVEERVFSQRHLDFLYTRDVTEYSVCIHVLANRLGYSNALEAFALCARLTRVVLNFPAIGFARLLDHCPIDRILRLPARHDFVEAIRAGIRAHDLGVLFYLFCNALPSDVAQSDRHFKKGLATALHSLGLQIHELLDAARAQAAESFSTIQNSPIEAIRALAAAGFDNFGRIPLVNAALRLGALNVPPALLGDDAVLPMFGGGGNCLEAFDLERCFLELDDGMSWTNRFAEACL